MELEYPERCRLLAMSGSDSQSYVAARQRLAFVGVMSRILCSDLLGLLDNTVVVVTVGDG